MNTLAYRHLSKKEREAYNASRGHGCYLFPVKKDGSKYKQANYYDFRGLEKTPEDVIARLEGLNPGCKWVIA